jgi:hypothetical protein
MSNNMRETRPIKILADWLSDHPAALGAIVLLLTSSVGYVYEKTLFDEFDINIFRFSSIYDFMYQWWRQGAVVHLFFDALLMIASMCTGYIIMIIIISKFEFAWTEKGDRSLGERILFGPQQMRTRATAIALLVLMLVIAVSFLLARAHLIMGTGEQIDYGVVMVFFYGAVVFFASWLGQHLIQKSREPSPWRWTSVALLLFGITYIFGTMLFNVRDVAFAEARMLKLDSKYTYTVHRSDADASRIISHNAKILAVTTYYHLFYLRESGKIIAINNQYVGMLESNWIR